MCAARADGRSLTTLIKRAATSARVRHSELGSRTVNDQPLFSVAFCLFSCPNNKRDVVELSQKFFRVFSGKKSFGVATKTKQVKW